MVLTSGEDNQIGNTNAAVLGQAEQLGRDVLESVVLPAAGFRSQDQAPITTTGAPLGLVPRAAVVENFTNCCTSIVVAFSSSGVQEHGRQVC